VIERCTLFAPYRETVLLLGETGTGKELLARLIHDESNRSAQPYKSVNCGVMTKELISSELFGHVKGSFTGGLTDKKGFFEEVGGGTLFLDEVGALPPECQSALLRVLDSGEYYRVGESEVRKFKGRIVAATHNDLVDKVREGRFIEDLAHRLGRFIVEVPPLRERRQDIPLLKERILQEWCTEYRTPQPVFTKEAMDRLLSYSWPGNVRQLQTVLRNAAVIFPGGRVDEENVDEALRSYSWGLHDRRPDEGKRTKTADREGRKKELLPRLLELVRQGRYRTKENKRLNAAALGRALEEDRHLIAEILQENQIE
jgi:two-component system response regulator AtoC